MAHQQPVDRRLTALGAEEAQEVIRGYEERIDAAAAERHALQAEVARLREYERRWRTLERVEHCWQQGEQHGDLDPQLAGVLWQALYWVDHAEVLLRCRRQGHDCATWQPPVDAEQTSHVR